MMNVNLVSFFILIAAVSAVKYDGYKVYNVAVRNGNELNIVKNVENEAIGEIWEDQFDIGRVVKIMVAGTKQEQFMYIMKTNGLEVTEVIEDLQKLINNQMKQSNIRTTESFLSLDWDSYHNLETIYTWLDELAANFPTIVSTIVIGKSVENRDIKGIVINYNRNRNETLIGMLEGTLHAREWISAATVTWIIKEFLTSTDPEVRALAENFEWHIFPVVNPDGYAYTFTHNRMWRKNRSTASAKTCGEGVNDDMSNGVDLNRNFDFQWMTVGASNDSCLNTYAGPTALSEPETAAIAEYVTQLDGRGKFIYYIAYHSYTQLIIIPYSHLASSTEGGLPENYGNMYQIAQRGAEAMAKRFGTIYRVGVSAEILYQMSGTSFDWVKQSTNVPVSYLIELRDLGEFGFLLPQEQIVPQALEVMDGFLAMDRTTRELGYYEQYNSGNSVIPSLVVVFMGVISVLLR